MEITKDILYVGVNDHLVDLFEGQYDVPNGMAYNSYLICDDKVAVMESNGSKISIPAKVKKFLREYKSEIKKIVWPTGRSVVKNTIVVLVMCAIVLLLVWAVDTGMGELLKLTYGVSAS